MPGLLERMAQAAQRLRGPQLEDYPEMAAAVATREIEEPERMKGVRVAPSMITRMRNLMRRSPGDSLAMMQHNPLNPLRPGNIGFDWAAIEAARRAKAAPPLQDLLEHELTHVEDRKTMGYVPYMYQAFVKEPLVSYGAGPLEGRALEREANTSRRYRTRDIRLKEPK